jgi:hypothetical protein
VAEEFGGELASDSSVIRAWNVVLGTIPKPTTELG